MPQNMYDVAILGAGPGGYSAALRAGQLGLKVALIEKDSIGGECLNRACIPTKSLSRSAAVFETVNNSDRFGIEHEQAAINWEKVKRRKEENINKLYKGLIELIKLRKIDLLNGIGKIENQARGSFSVSVNAEVINSINLIIATGTRPGKLKGAETDHINILTTADALSMDDIPESILIIGGGSSGIEFASIFRSFGSDVTLIEQSSSILTGMDEEVAGVLSRQFKRRGIQIYTSTKVKDIDQVNGQLRIIIMKIADGSEKEIFVQKVILATGRKPVTEDLGLENIGVKLTDNKFVKVNEVNKAVEGVFAVGDVVDTPALAHVAYNEGINAVDCIYGFKINAINYSMIPCALTSYPEIAKVGITEKEAKLLGIDISIGRFPMQANAKAQILGEPMGMVKIVSERRGAILGVHAVGPNMSEIIAEGQLVTNWEADGEDLAGLVHPHPTVSEAFVEAAMEMVGKALHTTNHIPEKRRAA